MFLYLALAALGVGGFFLLRHKKGEWKSATRYVDSHGRTWDRYDGIEGGGDAAPAGFSDWIRPGTGTAAVRIKGVMYEEVGPKLDAA